MDNNQQIRQIPPYVRRTVSPVMKKIVSHLYFETGNEYRE